MSRVAVTELPAGTPATTTDVNATISSWNAALAAGALESDNVRLEGIDRRSLSSAGHAVMGLFDQATAASLGLVTSAVDVALVTSSNLTPSPGGSIIVRASTFYFGEDQYSVNPTTVTLSIQSSTDGGTVWSTITATTLIRNNKAIDFTRVTGNYYAFYRQSTPAQIRYRLVYTVTPGSVAFSGSVLVVEQLAR